MAFRIHSPRTASTLVLALPGGLVKYSLFGLVSGQESGDCLKAISSVTAAHQLVSLVNNLWLRPHPVLFDPISNQWASRKSTVTLPLLTYSARATVWWHRFVGWLLGLLSCIAEILVCILKRACLELTQILKRVWREHTRKVGERKAFAKAKSEYLWQHYRLEEALMTAHRFYVVAKDQNDPGTQWDEVFALAPCLGNQWMIATTTDDTNEMMLKQITFLGGAARLVQGTTRHRTVPAGIPHVVLNQLNWICYPDANAFWEPTAAEMLQMTEDSTIQSALAVPAAGGGGGGPPMGGGAHGGALVPLGGGLPAPPGVGLGGVPGAPPPVAPGVAATPGLMPGGLGPSGSVDPADPAQILQLMNSMRDDFEKLVLDERSDKKKKKKKSGSGSRKKKKKKRSCSSSRSSSGDGGRHRNRGRVKWSDEQRNRPASPAAIREMGTLKFKSRNELLEYSTK